MGTQFSPSTSLPELAASIAAIRIRAPELAVTNLLGSNLFNMGFVLFIDDLAYSSSPLWIQTSQVHVITALIALLMSSTVLISMRKTIPINLGRFISIESIILISLYIVSSVLVFQIGGPLNKDIMFLIKRISNDAWAKAELGRLYGRCHNPFSSF